MARRHFGGLTCGLAALVLLGGCGSPPEKHSRYRIAVIPKGTTHDFWKSIHAGAVHAAATEGRAKILWEGPNKEDQRSEQQQIVERFTSEGVDAIVLAPCDRQSLVLPVEKALEKGIPVVIMDSGLDLPESATANANYLGYVATDNHLGGVKAAERMIELLKDKPHAKVLMLPYQAGSASTEQREAGFRETIRGADNIEFIEAHDEAGATVDSAQKVAERLLSDHKDLDGMFTPNESSTLGALQALEGLHRAGQVKLVGFDASEILIHALASGKLFGVVLQDPFDMGYQSVMRALDHREKKPSAAERTFYTNLKVATKANMNQREIKELYARDLSRYLSE
jgi:ribose transport system substrate-binding protein